MLQDARRARNALGPGSASQDVTEARRLEEELARRELFDEATGLADAALLADRAAVALARAGQSGAQVAVPAVGLGALEEVASTGGGRPKVAVNLSARQFGDSHLVERFSHACAACGVPPGSVGVELTESAFVATDDYGDYRALAALREMGVEVAVDDFGTGYSALSYLKHLPVDVIKIDRGFVAGLGVDRADMLVVEAVVRVAQGLGLRVVAEGVETTDQLDALRQLGCDAAQGYLLARPVPNDQLPGALDHASEAIAQ